MRTISGYADIERRRLRAPGVVLIVLAACALGSAPASAAPANFGNAMSYPAGTNASYVATADVNGDGVADLIVANEGSSDVTVRLGDRSGGFGAPHSYPAGKQPQSVVVDDFNGDGNPDLAVANAGDGTVSILLGNGKGGFGAPTPYQAGTSPERIAIGDFNGDGKDDLAVTNSNYEGTNLWILLGDGQGGFTATNDYAIGDDCSFINVDHCVSAGDVVAGDFNGDGHTDLVVTSANVGPDGGGRNGGGGVEGGSWDMAFVLLGDGQGGFGLPTRFTTGMFPFTTSGMQSIAVADLNGDGHLDLAIAGLRYDPTTRSYGDGVAVFQGDGAGNFVPAGSYPLAGTRGAGAVGIDDFNQDGHPDLAVATSTNDVAVLRGDGKLGFGPQVNFPVESMPVSLAAFDLNLDNRPDIVTANYDSNDASVLLNSTDTTAPTITVDTPADASSGITYTQYDTVPADYSCADEPGGSGIKSCQGDVANGQPLPLLQPGMYVFRVTATDNAGNTQTDWVTYRVMPYSSTSRPHLPPPPPPGDIQPAPQNGGSSTQSQSGTASPGSSVPTVTGGSTGQTGMAGSNGLTPAAGASGLPGTSPTVVASHHSRKCVRAQSRRGRPKRASGCTRAAPHRRHRARRRRP